MSHSTGTCSLGVFGLTKTQRMVLASLCKLSNNRAVSYTMTETSTGEPVNIGIVDADDSDAVKSWRSYDAQANTPVVFVSAQPLTDLEAHQYNLIRSQLSGGLLQILDRVAVGELEYKKPVIVNDDIEVEPSPGSKVSGSTGGSKFARALVIDDSLSVRTQMSICLEKLDLDVETAEDAQQGLEKLRDRYYDLVFLDVILPDMDGYQVCKLIKRDPLTKRIPVVMLTGRGSTINRIQGSMAGCDRYMVKPATEKDVAKVVKDFLPRVPEYVHLKSI